MVANVDYSAIPVPDEKRPPEYTYNERRAEILQLIEQKGHPWGFNYSELGRRYDVSHETIRKDFALLKDWYQDRIGEDAKVSSDLAYRRIVQEHMAAGKYDKARRALDSWNDWLWELGEQERAPDTLEVSSEGGGPIMVVETENSDE